MFKILAACRRLRGGAGSYSRNGRGEGVPYAGGDRGRNLLSRPDKVLGHTPLSHGPRDLEFWGVPVKEKIDFAATDRKGRGQGDMIATDPGDLLVWNLIP